MNVQRQNPEGRLALGHTNPPHALLIEPLVRQALAEDLGRAGDITTDAVIPADQWGRAVIAAREPGVICGLIAADLTFKLTDAGEPGTADTAQYTITGACTLTTPTLLLTFGNHQAH